MRLNRFPSVATALLIAACGPSSKMDEGMKRDLEAASAGAIELAPRGPRTTVVSPLESNHPVQPKVVPTRRVAVPEKRNPPERQVTQSTQTGPAAERPLPASSVSKPPPGGYKTIGEVLRSSPFPIKP